MKNFNDQVLKLLKRTAWIVGGLIAALLVFRIVWFVILNLTTDCPVLKEIASPKGTRILTVYHCSSWGGSDITTFHLRSKGEKMKFRGLNVFTGRRIEPTGDVLVMDGNFFPYGIVWLDDQSLLINVIKPIELEYKYYNHLVKMYSSKSENWEDVKISFGVLDQKRYPNEVRVDFPQRIMQ